MNSAIIDLTAPETIDLTILDPMEVIDLTADSDTETVAQMVIGDADCDSDAETVPETPGICYSRKRKWNRLLEQEADDLLEFCKSLGRNYRIN